jgi:hypothetical protein
VDVIKKKIALINFLFDKKNNPLNAIKVEID